MSDVAGQLRHQGVSVPRLPRSKPSAKPTQYLVLSLALTVVIGVGFWPGYFGPLFGLGGEVSRSWIVHAHAGVFVGWMLILLTQIALVLSGRTQLHRRMGTVGVVYGVLVFIMGVVVTFETRLDSIRTGELSVDGAAAALLVPLGDMVLFAVLFGAAVVYRRNSEVHRRLVIAATVALSFAAIGRLRLSPRWFSVLVWLAPLLVGMGIDRFRKGRVHPAYYFALGVLLAAYPRVFLRRSEAWLVVGRALLAPFLPEAPAG